MELAREAGGRSGWRVRVVLGLGDLSPLGQNWRTGSYLQCPPPSPTPSRGWRGWVRDLTPPIAIGRGGRGQDTWPGTSTNPPEGYEPPGGIAGSVQVERGIAVRPGKLLNMV